MKELEQYFGKFTVTRGNEHDYLGMKIVLTDRGTVLVDMRKEIMSVINNFSEIIEGKVTSPAGKNLYKSGDNQQI